MYGWPEPGQRNFAPWLIGSLRQDVPYHGPTDVLRTPVYVGHLVEGIEKSVTADRSGIFHVAGRDWVSMYEFARAIAEGFQVDCNLVIPNEPPNQPGAVQEGTPAQTARPPDRLGLNCLHSMEVLGLTHTGLAEGILALKNDEPYR